MDKGHETFVDQTPSLFLGKFRCIILVLAFHLLTQVDGLTQSSTITTYVGPSLPVAGTHATTQAFDSPVSVAAKPDGSFYFASLKQNRVYGVAPDGTLTVVAGTGAAGFSGDGGPAIAAELHQPQGLAVDAEGSLFIADYLNQRVRKITTDGMIWTVAGDGRQGSGGDGGPAVSAQFNGPKGVAVDTAGNLFIADSLNNRIRKITAAGLISTVVGFGFGGGYIAPGVWVPQDVTVDFAGNLFITDISNRVQKITPEGSITTVAGVFEYGGNGGCDGDGGPAVSAQLSSPSGVALDSEGNLLVVDTFNHRVQKISPTGVITTIGGTGRWCAGGDFSGDGGPAVLAQLQESKGIAIDPAGNVLIADTGNHRIRKISPDGIITTVAGSGTKGFRGDGGPAEKALLNFPVGLAMDSAGNLFIAEYSNHRVRKVSPSGIVTTVAGNGSRGFGGDGGSALEAQFNGPEAVVVDAAGNLFIADALNRRIRKVTPSGTVTTVAGTGVAGFGGDGGAATLADLNYPRGVAVDAEGNLLVADDGNYRVRRVSRDGVISTVVGNGTPVFSGDGGAAVSAGMTSPNGVAVDNAGNIFVATPFDNRVRKVAPSGVITTVAGTGMPGFSGDGGFAVTAQLHRPTDIYVDSTGNLFIADTYNHRIRMVSPDGAITTVAGNGILGFSGDGGPPLSAQFWGVGSIVTDSQSDLFIADSGNHRIRKVTLVNGPGR